MKKGIDIFSLAGKQALVTGATGYLGSAMAYALGEAGAHVLLNSRSHERAAKMSESFQAVGLSAEAAVFDVTKKHEVEDYFKSLQGSALHIVINNAYAGGAGNIEISSAESYQKSYEVTLGAASNIIRLALASIRKAVQETGDASVINIASMYGLVSPDYRIYESEKSCNPPFYGAAKAALIQWTRYAACEFGHEGIRVNAISPGPFPSIDVQQKSPAFIEKLNNKVPSGRIGQSEEIKGPVLFLASPASSYVNGSNVIVDGGWTCW